MDPLLDLQSTKIGMLKTLGLSVLGEGRIFIAISPLRYNLSCQPFPLFLNRLYVYCYCKLTCPNCKQLNCVPFRRCPHAFRAAIMRIKKTVTLHQETLGSRNNEAAIFAWICADLIIVDSASVTTRGCPKLRLKVCVAFVMWCWKIAKSPCMRNPVSASKAPAFGYTCSWLELRGWQSSRAAPR